MVFEAKPFDEYKAVFDAEEKFIEDPNARSHIYSLALPPIIFDFSLKGYMFVNIAFSQFHWNNFWGNYPTTGQLLCQDAVKRVQEAGAIKESFERRWDPSMFRAFQEMRTHPKNKKTPLCQNCFLVVANH